MKKFVILILLLILFKIKVFAYPNHTYYIHFVLGTAFLAYVGYSYYDTKSHRWYDFYLPQVYGIYEKAPVPGFINNYSVYSCVDVIRFIWGRFGRIIITIGRYVFVVIDRNTPKTKITTWGTTLHPQFYLENTKLVHHIVFDTEVGPPPCRPS